MGSLLRWTGRLAGLAGVLICAIATVVRVTGAYYLGGFQVATLFLAGIAAMLVACLSYLVLQVERGGR